MANGEGKILCEVFRADLCEGFSFIPDIAPYALFAFLCCNGFMVGAVLSVVFWYGYVGDAEKDKIIALF